MQHPFSSGTAARTYAACVKRVKTLQGEMLKSSAGGLHVLTDLFPDKQLTSITRAAVLDLRSRLLKKNAPATVNKVLGVVKVIFREALYREEINREL